MTPRIVSSDDSGICVSAVLSRTAPIVTFGSTISDTYPSHWQTSLTAFEAPGLPSAEIEDARVLGFSEGGKTSRDGHATLDDPFTRHDAYFFKDGNVTFLIDGTLYCVHRYFFSRDSTYFSTRFSRLGIRDHEALSTIISIGDVKRNDFEALLSILYPTNFEAHELTYEQWKSVLHLSTRWGFASLRKLALKSITPPTPYDQLVLARAFSVDQWVLPALTALCSRTLPLSLDEALQMSMEDIVLVATVREEIRSGALRVDAVDIPRHVEVAQVGKLIHPVGKDVYWDKPKSRSIGQESASTTTTTANPSTEANDVLAIEVIIESPLGPQQMAAEEDGAGDVRPLSYWDWPKSGSAEQESDSTMASGVDLNVEAEIAKTMEVVPPSRLQQRSTKEDDSRESDIAHSLKEVPVGSPGVGQPHVVEDTSRGHLKKIVAMYAVQTSGTRKLEEASEAGKVAASHNAKAETVVAENCAVGAMARLNAEAKVAMGHLDAEEARDLPDAEGEAIRGQETARAKEKADTEARNAAASVEKVQVEVEAKCEASSEVRARAEAEGKVREEHEATAVKVKVDAEAKKVANNARKADNKVKAATKNNLKWDMLPFHEKGKKKKRKGRCI